MHAQAIHSELTDSYLHKVKWHEILLMFFLLSLSGNPFIGKKEYELFVVVSFIIPIVHILRNHNKSISYRTLFIFVFLLSYELMHALMFKLDYSLTIFKITLVLLLAAASADILKDRFIIVLTKTMVIISLISFVFVFLCYVPGINKALYKLAEVLFPLNKDWKGYSTPTLLIFTFHPEFFTGEFSYVRNAGIFWESGAFAVFLNITLFLHYSSRSIRTFKDLMDKNSIILTVALLTTASTMGLLALMIMLTYFSSRLKTVMKFVLMIFIAMASYLAFSTVEFLGEKVQRELSESRVRNNRFGSALMDFEDIAKRPILGWSRRIEVVFNTTEFNAKTHRPNGLTNFLRSYGLVYFSIYFLFVYQSFLAVYRYHNMRTNFIIPAFGVFLLLLVSFSEVIFDLPFLKTLIFLYPAYYTPASFTAQNINLNKPIFFIPDEVSIFGKRFTL
jgi:hypothetical protein